MIFSLLRLSSETRYVMLKDGVFEHRTEDDDELNNGSRVKTLFTRNEISRYLLECKLPIVELRATLQLYSVGISVR
jgi:hypothetical protein